MIPPLPILDDGEEGDFVVCLPANRPTPFTDNVFTNCAKCGRGIQHRPHAPSKPAKICVHCLPSTPRGRMVMSRKSAEELEAMLKRRKH